MSGTTNLREWDYVAVGLRELKMSGQSSQAYHETSNFSVSDEPSTYLNESEASTDYEYEAESSRMDDDYILPPGSTEDAFNDLIITYAEIKPELRPMYSAVNDLASTLAKDNYQDFFSDLPELKADPKTIDLWFNAFEEMFDTTYGLKRLYLRKKPDDKKIPDTKLDIGFDRQFYPMWLLRYNYTLRNALGRKLDLYSIRAIVRNSFNHPNAMYDIYKYVLANYAAAESWRLQNMLIEIESFIQSINSNSVATKFHDIYEGKLLSFDSGLPEFVQNNYEIHVLFLLYESNLTALSEVLIDYYHKKKKVFFCREFIFEIEKHPSYRQPIARNNGPKPKRGIRTPAKEKCTNKLDIGKPKH